MSLEVECSIKLQMNKSATPLEIIYILKPGSQKILFPKHSIVQNVS
jgi:hypothetical protein